MKIVGNLVAFPEARFTPQGEYRVYFDVRVTEGVTVSCVMKDMLGESFIDAIYHKDERLIVGMRLALHGVDTIRRYKNRDGKTIFTNYINVTELVCKIEGEATRFSNDL